MINILTKLYNKLIIIFFKTYDLLRYEFPSDTTDYLNEQELIYKKLGLDRAEGLAKIKSLLIRYPEINSDMNSEHSIIFSSLALSSKPFKNILEIGTYDGKNAALLSNSFSNSQITTIDLPENDNIFKNSYQRQNKENRQNFCNKRNQLLKKYNNIKFIELNSLELINFKDKFDLIWIDGAHGYPYSTIDIVNSIRLINKFGIILCDDIYKQTRKDDKFYTSKSSYETLNALKDAGIINYRLFYKRIDKKVNSNPFKNKFIGAINSKINL